MLYLPCVVKLNSKKTNHSEISGSLDIDPKGYPSGLWHCVVWKDSITLYHIPEDRILQSSGNPYTISSFTRSSQNQKYYTNK